MEPREDVRRAYDLLAQDYARLRSRGFEEVARLMSGRRYRAICDAGSGPGTYGELFAKLGLSLIQLDISAKMVEMGWRRAFAEGIAWKTNCVICDVSCLPIRDNSMDMTASIAVVHHLPKDLAMRALGELFRITAKLGTLLMSVWLPEAMDRFGGVSTSEEERMVWWKAAAAKVGRRYWRWSPEELKSACVSCGMSYLDVFVSNGNIFAQALRI